jgi:hypothetical protein
MQKLFLTHFIWLYTKLIMQQNTYPICINVFSLGRIGQFTFYKIFDFL